MDACKADKATWRSGANSMTEPQVLILATLETKEEESRYLAERLAVHGVRTLTIDLSLGSGGEIWGSERKLAEIDRSVAAAVHNIADRCNPARQVAVGLGGGTGSEIILRVMRSFPMTAPKILVTPLPFDPRAALADNAVIVVPSLADICGLNDTLRGVLEHAAALAAGLCRAEPVATADCQSVAITSLGATAAGTDALLEQLREEDIEATVFHANGYGGAALVRMVEQESFDALVDLTTHELTRIMIDGPHVPMPNRFSAAGNAGIPRIVLPGGLNFLGLDAIDTVAPKYLERPHYRHSGFFTHVKLTGDEMERVAASLCEHLNASPLAGHLIVPMGGFSHQDRPGGAICDPVLREAFLGTATRLLDRRTEIVRTDAHIGDPEVALLVMERLSPILRKRKESSNALPT